MDVTAQHFRDAAARIGPHAPLHPLLLAAAEQREQLDVCQSKATGYEVAILNLTSMLNRTEQQVATLTAERDALTAANKSLDAHCMVLQHDIRTCLAESDDAPREQLLGELSQQVVDLGLWNASQREQIATLTERIAELEGKNG